MLERSTPLNEAVSVSPCKFDVAMGSGQTDRVIPLQGIARTGERGVAGGDVWGVFSRVESAFGT